MQAAQQCPLAFRVLSESPQLFVPLTVILELEWMLRAFYGFTAEDFARVIRHLLGLPNVMVEEWPRINDALHLQASAHCKEMLSFDHRRLARRASSLGISPAVVVPDQEQGWRHVA